MLRFAVGVCCSVWFGEILSVPELRNSRGSRIVSNECRLSYAFGFGKLFVSGSVIFLTVLL